VGIGPVSWALWIEWWLEAARRAVVESEGYGAHESPDARKEKLCIADGAVDFEGRDSESTQIGGMTQVAENEHTPKRNEEQPQKGMGMAGELLENRDA